MNIDDILRLQEAGYSADEIAKLAPLIKEAPAPAKVVQKEDPKADERFTALNEKVDNLINTIQELSIKQSDQKPADEQPNLVDIANTILGGK